MNKIIVIIFIILPLRDYRLSLCTICQAMKLLLLVIMLACCALSAATVIHYHGEDFEVALQTFARIDYLHCNFLRDKMVVIELSAKTLTEDDQLFFETFDNTDSYSGVKFGPANSFLVEGILSVARNSSLLTYPPAIGFFNGNTDKNLTVVFSLDVFCKFSEE